MGNLEILIRESQIYKENVGGGAGAVTGEGVRVGRGPENGSLPSLHLPGSPAWVPLGAGGVK